jgi:hypothetical protein
MSEAEAKLTTNSPRSVMFRSVSFRPTEVNWMIGGVTEATV